MTEKEYFLSKGAGPGERPLHSEVSLYRESFLEERKAVVELLKPKGKAILEVGIGEGELSIQFVLDEAAQVIALDIHHQTLSDAKERAKSVGVENDVYFVRGDIEHLPFKDISFEAVACIGTFMHLPNPKAAIAELSRVLKEGGGLFVATAPFNPWKCLVVPVEGMTIKERLTRFWGTIANFIMSQIFGFTWNRIGLTNRLYYSLFNIPIRHYTQRQFLRFFNQPSIQIVSVKTAKGAYHYRSHQILCEKAKE